MGMICRRVMRLVKLKELGGWVAPRKQCRSGAGRVGRGSKARALEDSAVVPFSLLLPPKLLRAEVFRSGASKKCLPGAD